MSVSLFGVIIAIVLGVNLLHQELGRKTIFNILSKPVARWQFIVGQVLRLVGDAQPDRRAHVRRRGRLLRLGDRRVRLGARGRVVRRAARDHDGDRRRALLLLARRHADAGRHVHRRDLHRRPLGELPAVLPQGRPAAGVQALAHALYWVLPRLDRFTIADRVVYGVVPDPPISSPCSPIPSPTRDRPAAQHRPLRPPRVRLSDNRWLRTRALRFPGGRRGRQTVGELALDQALHGIQEAKTASRRPNLAAGLADTSRRCPA